MSSPNVFEELFQRRLTRRDALGALLAGAGLAACRSSAGPRAAASPSSLSFGEVPHGADEHVHVPDGYRVERLLSWGDPLFADSPDFYGRDAGRASAAAQERQFGANADWVAWLPHPSGRAQQGLLAVNHEFANAHMMVPGYTARSAASRATRAECELEMAAIGMSIVEVERGREGWRALRGAPLNRRVSALSTRIGFSGPAAGHERLRSTRDPEGELVRTFNNCGGGLTPWGTVLTCEENFDWHFHGRTGDAREGQNHERYQIADHSGYSWHRHFERFDAAKEPREPNRYGWVIELDPYDPSSRPLKRTALGRIKHESASCAVAPDGRVAVYSGDDDEFEHLYRFVTKRPWNPRDRAANARLLDEGELQAARFEDDGTLTWLPLVHGRGPLTKENGFADQGEVLIETRRAAHLCGATQMDRPEDVEVHPDGRVYVMLTNNRKRETPDAANPRARNRSGHVIELVPPTSPQGTPDHAARSYAWNVLLVGGDPRAGDDSRGRYHPDTSEHGWLACPDNAAVDPAGRLWIATDGASRPAGFTDGVWACDLDGPGRALTRRFFRGPLGCEVCGPFFHPDGRTLFLAVQHPGIADASGKGIGSFEHPTTRYPDFEDGVPPRSTVVAIVREDGGVVGS